MIWLKLKSFFFLIQYIIHESLKECFTLLSERSLNESSALFKNLSFDLLFDWIFYFIYCLYPRTDSSADDGRVNLWLPTFWKKEYQKKLQHRSRAKIQGQQHKYELRSQSAHFQESPRALKKWILSILHIKDLTNS